MPYRQPPATKGITSEQIALLSRAFVVKTGRSDRVEIVASWRSTFLSFTLFYAALAITPLMSLSTRPAPVKTTLALSGALGLLTIWYAIATRIKRSVTFFHDIRAVMVKSGPFGQTRPLSSDLIQIGGIFRSNVTLKIDSIIRRLQRRWFASAATLNQAVCTLREIIGESEGNQTGHERLPTDVPAIAGLRQGMVDDLVRTLYYGEVSVEPDRISFWSPPLFKYRGAVGFILCVVSLPLYFIGAQMAAARPVTTVVAVCILAVGVIVLCLGVFLLMQSDRRLNSNILVVPRGLSEIVMIGNAGKEWTDALTGGKVTRFRLRRDSFNVERDDASLQLQISCEGWQGAIGDGSDSERCRDFLARFSTTGDVDDA